MERFKVGDEVAVINTDKGDNNSSKLGCSGFICEVSENSKIPIRVMFDTSVNGLWFREHNLINKSLTI